MSMVLQMSKYWINIQGKDRGLTKRESNLNSRTQQKCRYKPLVLEDKYEFIIRIYPVGTMEMDMEIYNYSLIIGKTSPKRNVRG